MYRRQLEAIIKDLNKKIVFVVGPRQVGKTWLAREAGKNYEKTVYLNYDRLEDRRIIQEESWLPSTDLLILDELHKMTGWKNYLKGIFDTKQEKLKILVTGSARLDIFRQAGDSLAGRYFTHRLLPFSLSELKDGPSPLGLDRFIERGGFPEPFLAENDTDPKRWRNQFVDGFIRNDVLDFEKIHNFKTIQTVFELVRRRVGSPLSMQSIARDVNASSTTIANYIRIFEALYLVFRVPPYSRNIARSLLKEPKMYFYDNGLVIGDEGAKLENFTAVSLLKHVYGRNDYEGAACELKYLRTKDGLEADFCLVKEDNIEEVIEVKTGDALPAPGLKYFCGRYGLKGTQLVKELKREKTEGNISIRRAEQYLKELYL